MSKKKNTKLLISAIINGLIFVLPLIIGLLVVYLGDGDFTFNGESIKNNYWFVVIIILIDIVVWGFFTVTGYMSLKALEEFIS